jgi:hypothetical protein
MPYNVTIVSIVSVCSKMLFLVADLFRDGSVQEGSQIIQYQLTNC